MGREGGGAWLNSLWDWEIIEKVFRMKAGLRHCLKSCDSCFVGKVVSTIDGDCRTLKVS